MPFISGYRFGDQCAGSWAGHLVRLVGSNITVSLVRDFVPSEIRIPVFVMVIATFVTIIQLLMNAYVFQLYQSLGIFIPLIVTNCAIIGRAEAYASKTHGNAPPSTDWQWAQALP